MDQAADTPYFEIIQRHFPATTRSDVTAVYSGNDHRVFVVGGKAFRFPIIPREIDPRRSKLLKRLAPLSPLPLPMIEICQDSVTGIYYELNDYIPGTSFHPALAKLFSHEELMEVARQLGAFLSAVHTFPVQETRELALDEISPEDFWNYMQNNPHAYPEYQRLVIPYVALLEQIWIERLFSEYIAEIKATPFQTRVTHADMWTYHIIVDVQARELTGVIDFWGRIADPAADFKAFEYYGEEFVREVYQYYTPPLDDGFEKRRLFYTGRDEVSELARQLRRGDEQKVARSRASLSAYIAAHPLM